MPTTIATNLFTGVKRKNSLTASSEEVGEIKRLMCILIAKQ